MRMFKINFGAISGIVDLILSALARLIAAWPFSWRSMSAMILGIVMANWFWIFLAPQAIFIASQTDTAMGQNEERIFGLTQTADTANQGATVTNAQLLGVFTASSGTRGFAVMQLDAKRQIGVAEGGEVAPGTKLLEVHANHVILERSGVKHRVDMINQSADSTQAYKPSGTAEAKKPGLLLKQAPR